MTYDGSRLAAAGLSAVALLLSSCALTKGPDEQVVLRLIPPRVEAAPAAAQGEVKLVPPRAQGVISQLRYAYSLGDGGAMQQARTLVWDRPPPEYLERAMAAALQAAGLHVAGSSAPGKPGLRLSPTLLQFEERSGPATHAAVAFDVEFAREGKPVVVRRYCGRAPIRSANPEVRATAFGEALDVAVKAFVQDVPGTAMADRMADCAVSLPSSSR
ncbi:MAG: hypothetical protein ACKOVA_02760 [Novosphingobium sp.]